MLSCRGLPSQAFEYILYNKGLMGEDSYPYRAKVLPAQPQPRAIAGPGTGSNSSSLSPQNGTCKFQPEKAVAFVKDVINITQVRPRGLHFQTSRAVPREGAGMPKACWAQQLELQPVCSWRDRAAVHPPALLHFLEGGTKEVMEPKYRPLVPACFPQWVHLQAGTESWFLSYNSAPGSQGYPCPVAWLQELGWSQHSREMRGDPGSSLAVR